MTNEQILQTVNVAFNEKVKKVLKKSYNKTIDVQFGTYEDGRMTINLKPSHGWRDWLINLCAFGKMHYGYRAEFQKYGGDILSTIYASKELWEASRKGVIIAGRSKGGAEALIIGVSLVLQLQYEVEVGGVDPANAGTRKYIEFAEKIIGKNRIHSTCYRNDIVPAIPFWLHYAGIRKQYGGRRLGLSIKDHIKATTDISIFS